MTAPRALRDRFLRDRRGVSAVEFALVGPTFIFLVLGVFDFATVLFLALTIENATLNAARFGATGQVPTGVTRDERIREIVHEHTLGILDDNDLKIETLVYASYADIATAERLDDANGDKKHNPGETFDDVNHNAVWDGDPGKPGSGAPEAIVLYRVSAEYRFITPLLSELGPVSLSAAAPIRNEPFEPF